MFGPGGSFFVWGRDEWRDERTDCQRGGCMVLPGAVVSPGHTKRLSLLPCSRPAGSLSVLVFWGVRCGGLPGGGGPSALRWMAAGAEFPCDVPGGGVASALRWMWVG